jgi:hypothetical protein
MCTLCLVSWRTIELSQSSSEARKIPVVLMVTASALWAADKYQPLDVKTGLWEVSTTISTGGQLPIPADLLEKLTPEQRARFEERMNAKSLQPAKPIVSKNCLTQEQLDKGDSFTENRKSCTHTIVSSTRSKAEVRLTVRGKRHEIRCEAPIRSD